MAIPVQMAFQPDSCKALLTIEKDSLDFVARHKEATTFGLLNKDEFHVTVIGSETGDAITKYLQSLEVAASEKIRKGLEALCTYFPWEVSLTDEYYYIEKYYTDSNSSETEQRQSIIQLIEIQQFELFYAMLNFIVKADFEVPLPHITLFTNSSNPDKKLRGIGIYSVQEFNELQPVRL